MKSIGIWFLLSCKRYLKRVSFLLILLVLPAVTFFVRGLEKKEGQEVRIAVCVEDAGEREETKPKDEAGGGRMEHEEPDIPLETELLEALTGDKADGEESLFRFYRCESEEEVKARVASRRAECGYVVSRDLRRKLDEKDYRRCIRVYSAPSTVLSSLSTEVVFASLMKLYDREIFLDYVTEAEVLLEMVPEEVPEALFQEERPVTEGQAPKEHEGLEGAAGRLKALAGQLYDKWLNNGSTFRFAYHYGEREGTGAAGETENLMVFPVRGIVAVYLFLTGLYSAVMLGSDERKGLFAPLPPGKRWACRLAVLAAPVFLGALSALAALKSGGCVQNGVLEIRVMAFYVLAVCLFSYGAKALCRKPQVLCCLIPVFLVGSLLFAPVLVDIRQFFPSLGWIEKLFLPSYYLRAF